MQAAAKSDPERQAAKLQEDWKGSSTTTTTKTKTALQTDALSKIS
jgi:hypothetical protein